ncbi:hypothetical protein GF314_11090 [bacterium]|nr:hypothetical protein [bacterium]
MAWLAGVHWDLVVVLLLATAALLWGMRRARRHGPAPRRRIAGLEAMSEAVGRATEMGRPVMYVAGTQDLDDVQTVASLGILGAVGEMTARHGCELIMPTDRSLVLTAGREVLRESYASAGRSDDFVPDMVSYVSDDQFGFAARVDGVIARRRPAAIFLQGAFYAESLLLAEAGAQVGAMQVAGTAMSHQLPFLVAACDHVLIGEEFFAAEAYLTGDVDRLGSLRGQDLVKDVTIGVLLIGALMVTVADVSGWAQLAWVRDALLAFLEG